MTPAPTNNAGSTVGLPPCEDRTGELQKGGAFQAVLRSQTQYENSGLPTLPGFPGVSRF